MWRRLEPITQRPDLKCDAFPELNLNTAAFVNFVGNKLINGNQFSRSEWFLVLIFSAMSDNGVDDPRYLVRHDFLLLDVDADALLGVLSTRHQCDPVLQ